MSPVAAILLDLLRFNTTNPPGAEAACIAYLKHRFESAGIEYRLYARDPHRPNLVARVSGRGEAPPLLLYGHVDVVPVTDQQWTHPPFAGRVIDGWVWGRGALDMKDGIAMYADALLHAAKEPPRGDLIFLALADEETGGKDGAQFMVERHPEVFTGVRHAFGEFGGATYHLQGRRLYPIMVAEKTPCIIRATVTGTGGHGSLPHRGGAIAKLARFLATLDRHRLPVHITPPARHMVEAMADALGGARGLMLRQLLHPRLTGWMLDRLGPDMAPVEATLYNTANATVVRGGDKFNVIPSKVEVTLDCRLLPGQHPEDLLRELRAIAGPEVTFTVERLLDGGEVFDISQFEMLAGVLRDLDPGCYPIPNLLPAATDGRTLAKLGIQTYGFTPLKLPAGFSFYSTIHAENERVPVEAVEWGARAVWEAVRRYGSGQSK